MTKLRLLVTDECNRCCEGCCNKDWDLDALPVCNGFGGYEMIMLTGGEPMLYPEGIYHTLKRIREETSAPVYLYTAKLTAMTVGVLGALDGITVTLHTKADAAEFHDFEAMIPESWKKTKSFKLNVFSGVYPWNVPAYWYAKLGIKWIKNCPLPHDEVFMRLA